MEDAMVATFPMSPESRRFLTPREAALYLGVTLRTLERWRVEGRPPVFCKLTRLVRYDVRVLDAFMASRQRTSTSDPGPEEHPAA
jgi:hypothetical protein